MEERKERPSEQEYEGHHYGSKIYKNNTRKFPFIWIGLILFFAGAIVLFKFMTPRTENLELRAPIKKTAVEESDNASEMPVPVEDDFKLSDDELPFAHLRKNKDTNSQPKEHSLTDGKQHGSLLTHREQTAKELFRKKKFREALTVFEKLSQRDSKFLADAGICCFKLERYQDATRYLEEALSSRHNTIEIRKYLALSYYKLDNIERTKHHMNEGLNLGDDMELMALKRRIGKEDNLMDDYSTVEKVNFKIRFSQTEHREIETTVSGILDDAYRMIGNQFNYYPSGSVTVILYNEKNFYDITRSPGWAGGLYDGKIHVPIGGYAGDEKLLREILFHEYVHSLVHSITTQCPIWLNEGLAEYFSKNDRRTIGQLIPMKYLNAAFRSSKIEIIYTAYLQSFSVVSDMSNQYGLYRIKDLLMSMKEGMNFEEAFNKIFYMTFPQFSKTWGR